MSANLPIIGGVCLGVVAGVQASRWPRTLRSVLACVSSAAPLSYVVCASVSTEVGLLWLAIFVVTVTLAWSFRYLVISSSRRAA
jgi:hypothetical protein